MRMQLVGRAPGRAAWPRTRKASISPPPIRADSPRRRQPRLVVASQFVKSAIGARLPLRGGSTAPIRGSVLEDEFGRVEEGPQEVLGRRAAVRPRLGEERLANAALFLRRQAAEREEIQLLDDLPRRPLATGEA